MPKKPVTAEQLNAELEERYRTDSVFRAEVLANDAARERIIAERERAERPVLADLRAVGVRLESLWEDIPASHYSKALPVLMDHLERPGQHPDISNALGNLMAVKASGIYWDRLKALFLGSDDEGQQDGAAIALAGCATRERYDELLALARDETRTGARLFFLAPIRTFGRERGWAFIESVRDHPLLGEEATAMLKRRRRRS